MTVQDQPYEQQRVAAGMVTLVAAPVAVRLGAVVAVLVVASVLVRAFHVLSFDFPLNDGGLFFAMTRDLQDAGYLLPSTTSYNGGDIPFAYPPLGFYVAGLLDQLTPMSLVDVFRFLPWLATSLTVPAFYLLSRSLLPSRAAVVASVLAFAFIPRGYIWLLMGGGVTRALGFLFAVLALYAVHRVYKEGKPSMVALASLLCGLTVLSHLETAWFLALSCALFFVAFGRTRRGAVNSALIGVGTIAVAAPWWGAVLLEHGIEPFQAAAGTGGTVFAGGEATRSAYLGLLRFVSTSEPLFPVLGALGLLGLMVSVLTRRFLLPVWWALIVLLEVRGFPTYTTVPVAMMAGIGIAEVMLPLLFSRRPPDDGANNGGPATNGSVVLRRPSVATLAPLLVLAGLVVYTGTASLLRDPVLGAEGQVMTALSGDTREAMAWIREEAPEDSSFLVIPETPFWEVSKTLEWFPALTGRDSVSTVQGSEWLANDGFDRARATHHHAWLCGSRTAECLEDVAEARDVRFTHVYVPNASPCCTDLLRSLQEDSGYQLLYRGKAALVYERVGAD